MKIEMLVMDVDGTLTDGKIYISKGGEACKAFDVKDGYGIHDILIPAGILPVIITGRESKIVEYRCRELGITEIHQGVKDKLAKLMEITRKHKAKLMNVAYIGDDLNDMSCMCAIKTAGGIVGCPGDAVEDVQLYSDYVMKTNGGEGAVRDFIALIIRLSETNDFYKENK